MPTTIPHLVPQESVEAMPSEKLAFAAVVVETVGDSVGIEVTSLVVEHTPDTVEPVGNLPSNRVVEVVCMAIDRMCTRRELGTDTFITFKVCTGK